MNGKHYAALALAAFGAYQIFLVTIPDQGANLLEVLSSGSDSLSGGLQSEFASGQLLFGAGALGLAWWLGFHL